VGDLVQTDDDSDWTVAEPAMRVLDNLIPYIIVPGNHDYYPDDISRATKIDNYFAPESMPWINGVMEAGKIENNFTLLDIGPQKWLVLGLEFGPRDAVMVWADAVLKAYAAYPAIILTHAYLYDETHRYDITAGSYQSFYPQFYGLTPDAGINDGEMMWQKLVLPNSNVRLVFCGHETGGALLTSVRPDGSTVYQMLSDYQWLGGDDFGFGYLRIVRFDYGNRTIQVQTYSPYCDGNASPACPYPAYLPNESSDGGTEAQSNQFTVELNL
jgi:hypothetical protein